MNETNEKIKNDFYIARLKIWLDLGKWSLGTLIFGSVALWVSYEHQNKKIALANLEQQRFFLESFVEHGMSKDILSRIRLAHYIKSTSTDNTIRGTWKIYYQELADECKKIHLYALEKENKNMINHYGLNIACSVGGTEQLDNQEEKVSSITDGDFLINTNKFHVEEKILTARDIFLAAKMIGTDVNTIRAVIDVESLGEGFYIDGRPKILFEGHIFWREIAKQGIDPRLYIEGNDNILYKKWNRKYYQSTPEGSYDRLSKAYAINKEAALKATSWGLFQIMGFNYNNSGFNDIEQYIDGMFLSEGEQLFAFMNFLKSESLDKYLIKHDWKNFARGYNGPSYEKNGYHIELKKSYEKYTKEKFNINSLMKNPIILKLQKNMAEQGIYKRDINGLLDENTKLSLKKFRDEG